MKTNKDLLKPKRFITIKRILLGIGITLIILVATFTISLLLWLRDLHEKEEIIDKQFHQEVKHYKEITVKNFMLWEGDSLVTITIKNKGDIRFWYGVDKIPRIDNISDIPTSFTCFYTNKTHTQRTPASFTLDLWLDTSSPYHKWFPFTVTSLHDLIVHYDDIVTVLRHFPYHPQLQTLRDTSGITYVRKNPDPRYTLITTIDKKLVACDLFIP